MEKKYFYEYRHWEANKKVMDRINKREKNPETLRLIERRQKTTKPGNLRFKFDSNLNQIVWVPQRSDKRGRGEVAAIDPELLFRNNEKNRWFGSHFEFNELKMSSGKEQKATMEQTANKRELISSTEGVKWRNLFSIFPSCVSRNTITPKTRCTLSKLTM